MIRVYLATSVADKFVRYAAGRKVPQKEQDAFVLLRRLVFSQKQVYMPEDAFRLPHVVSYFSGQSRVSIKSDGGLLERVGQDAACAMEQPAGIFILDMENVQANQIQKDYGVVSQGFIGDGLAVIGKRIPECYFDHNCQETWSSMLRAARDIPSNACIIYDKYFFNNIGAGKRFSAEKTLTDILEGLLPKMSKVEYHVLIWYEHQHTEKPADEIAELVEQTVAPIRKKYSYPIRVEVLSHENRAAEGSKEYGAAYSNLHDRCIICNYLYINPTANIKLFSGAQTIYFSPAFSNIKNEDLLQYPYVKINSVLCDMKKFLKICRKEMATLPADYLFLYRDGVKVENLKLENRLLL